jgi:transcription initiation factor TFIID subunit 2
LFTTGHDARLWFPCVDSYCEPSTWTIEVTVEESLTVVASGELVECTTNNELKTYRFYLSTPAPAPFIGLAIGYFFFNTIESLNVYFLNSDHSNQ